MHHPPATRMAGRTHSDRRTPARLPRRLPQRCRRPMEHRICRRKRGLHGIHNQRQVFAKARGRKSKTIPRATSTLFRTKIVPAAISPRTSAGECRKLSVTTRRTWRAVRRPFRAEFDQPLKSRGSPLRSQKIAVPQHHVRVVRGNEPLRPIRLRVGQLPAHPVEDQKCPARCGQCFRFAVTVLRHQRSGPVQRHPGGR